MITKQTKRIIITTIILSSSVTLLSHCLKIDEKKIYDIVDEVQRTFIKNKDLNDQIIKNPVLLERRINRDIDKSIRVYHENEQKSYVPRMKNKQILDDSYNYPESQKFIIQDAIYYELPKDTSTAQELLGRPMGLRSPWTTPHPNEITD